MPGTVKWTATYRCDAEVAVSAELYDSGGNVVMSEPIDCEPPIECPFPMENVPFGVYRAGLSTGGSRWYYDESQAVITVPDDEARATSIELSETSPSVEIVIVVRA